MSQRRLMFPQREAPVVAIANTLPIRHGDDGWELSPGGLVTALRPVMETRSGAWVGWDGGTKGVPATLPALETSLLPISLSSALDERPGALAWVHDYHLTLVPGLIRERRPDQPIGFFLHVPWPAPEIFGRLPWRQEMLLGMLGADVISFHAERYRDNFVRACARLLTGQGVSVHGSAVVLPDQRRVSTTTAPISIDTAEFRRLATDQSTVSEIDGLTEQFAGRTLLLGVDRLDYTKGIIERCWPWRTCSSRVPVCGRRSRSCRWPYPAGTTCPNTGACGTLWRATSAGSTAGSPSRARTFPCTTCIAACPLSRAAWELPEAIACNPFDVEGLSLRIEHALGLSASDRRAAITAMARYVAEHDVHRWVDAQLSDIGSGTRPGPAGPALG